MARARGDKALESGDVQPARRPSRAGARGCPTCVRWPPRETVTATLVLHEAATTSLAGVELPARGEIVIVVGPEGGIADEELAAFEAAGAAAVRLGEPVLRTSTAGAAALAALSIRLGRWSAESMRDG